MADDNERQEQENTAGSVTDGLSDTVKGVDQLTGNHMEDAIKKGSAEALGTLGEKAGEAGAEAAQEALKRAAQAIAAEAAEDAAGAATAGVGKAVMMAGRVTLGFFDPEGHDGGQGFKNLMIAFAAILSAFIMLPTLFTSYIEGTDNASAGKARNEKSYDMHTTGEAKKNGTVYTRKYTEAKSIAASVKKWFLILIGEKDEIFGDLDPYTQDNSMYDACEKTIKYLKKVFVKAKQQSWKDTLSWMAMNFILDDDGRRATTMSYENNGEIFEEVNYAELIAVMNQNEEYNEENIETDKLKKLFKGKNALRHLYRLNIEKIKCTKQVLKEEYGIDIIDEIRDPATGKLLGDDREKEVTWGLVTLRKYYLIDLYKLMDLNAYDTHYRNEYDTNLDMLEKQEPVMRSLSDLEGRKDDEDLVELYGPNERSEWDGEPVSTYIDDTPEVVPDLEFYDITLGDMPYNRLDEVFSDEEVVLPMGRYLNQGDPAYYGITRGNGKTSVASSACCDFSWAMVAEYFTGYTFDIRQLESMYVSGTMFQTPDFLKAYGMSSSGKSPLNVDAMRSIIKGGTPLVLHISGITNYHHTTNGHFLVIMGYNQEGFYVYDPGSRANTYKAGAVNSCIKYSDLMADAAGNSEFYYIAPTYNGSVQRQYAATSDDETLLAQLLYQEAGNQGVDGMRAVGEIVRNRVNSKDFPGTYRQVIMQTNQFSSKDKLANHTPTAQELAIAREVMAGNTNVLGSENVFYYKNTSLTSDTSDDNDGEGSSWYGKPYYTQIGDHTFYGN